MCENLESRMTIQTKVENVNRNVTKNSFSLSLSMLLQSNPPTYLNEIPSKKRASLV